MDPRDSFTFAEFCSAETVRSGEEGFFHDFANDARAAAGLKWIDEVFYKIDNNEDRLRALYTNDKLTKILQNHLSKVKTVRREKSAITSKMTRLDAISMFQRGLSEKPLSLINIAVMTAPPRGKCRGVDGGYTLPLAYFARSQIFMDLGEYEYALEDLRLGWEVGASPEFYEEIKSRAEECQRKIEERELNPEAVPRKGVRTYPSLTTCRELPCLSGGINPELPSLSVKVGIRETESAGKEAYAKNEISPGECILIEDPLVSIVKKEFFGSNCQECLSRLYAPVSCPNCHCVAFCSRKCRDIACSTYHRYECDFMPLMMGSGMSNLSLLAYRAITQESLDTCLKIYEALNKKKNDEIIVPILKKEQKNETKLSKSARRRRRKKKLIEATVETSETTDDLSADLSSMSVKDETPVDTRLYELVNHNSRRKAFDIFERTLMAAFLLKCLQRTNFFKTTSADYDVPNDEEIIVGSLILNNIQSFQFNAHEIYDTLYKYGRLDRLEESYVGLGIYPTVSRFNHECFPAVSRYHSGKKVVMHALKVFQPDDPIPENYGAYFLRTNRTSRQSMLDSRYWFKCNCKACDENWLQLPDLTNSMAKLRCPTRGCKKLFPMQRYKKLEFCNICRKKVDVDNVCLTLLECQVEYENGEKELRDGNVFSAINHFIMGLHNFYKIAAPPHKDTVSAQVLLKCMLGYFGNAYKFPEINQDKYYGTED